MIHIWKSWKNMIHIWILWKKYDSYLKIMKKYHSYLKIIKKISFIFESVVVKTGFVKFFWLLILLADVYLYTKTNILSKNGIPWSNLKGLNVGPNIRNFAISSICCTLHVDTSPGNVTIKE